MSKDRILARDLGLSKWNGGKREKQDLHNAIDSEYTLRLMIRLGSTNVCIKSRVDLLEIKKFDPSVSDKLFVWSKKNFPFKYGQGV